MVGPVGSEIFLLYSSFDYWQSSCKQNITKKLEFPYYNRLHCLNGSLSLIYIYRQYSNFIKRETPTQVNFANFLRTPILKNIC